nr:AI-2E family transporter [Bacilli bacterium]
MLRIIILVLIYILYKVGFIGKLVNASLPFLLAFVLAYIFYPLELKLNKKFPKIISISIIILSILLFIFILFKIMIPLFISESSTLINILTQYVNNLSYKFNIDTTMILKKINGLINYNHIINGISISINFITKTIICFISFIYILYDMDKITLYIRKIKILNYLIYINKDISKYISSLIKISIISFIEYTLVFFIIRHPNPLMVGMLAGILNMIPFIGGIITVFITILLSPSMIIKISITYIVLGLLDGYIITPYVYGKYNKINPLLGLIALSIGGIFGPMGIILSIPILIIVISTYKYLKDNNINIVNMIQI